MMMTISMDMSKFARNAATIATAATASPAPMGFAAVKSYFAWRVKYLAASNASSCAANAVMNAVAIQIAHRAKFAKRGPVNLKRSNVS
jgi:hypothetical protein